MTRFLKTSWKTVKGTTIYKHKVVKAEYLVTLDDPESLVNEFTFYSKKEALEFINDLQKEADEMYKKGHYKLYKIIDITSKIPNNGKPIVHENNEPSIIMSELGGQG